MPYYTTHTYHYPRTPLSPVSSSPSSSPILSSPRPIIHQTPPSPLSTPPQSPKMPHSTSPPRVSIQPSPSSYSRLPRDDESYVMRAFTKHAAHCTSCADPYVQYKKGGSLCPRGHRRASDVAQYIYSSRGVSYSVVDREGEGRVLVQVEIPPKAVAVKSLLRAVERGMRIETERERTRAKEREVEVHQQQAAHPHREQRGRHYERTRHDGYYGERQRRKVAPTPIFTGDAYAIPHSYDNRGERYYAVRPERYYHQYQPTLYSPVPVAVQGGYYR